ncbi:MAG: hypothetical protein LBM04_03460 [Opitutaceae bacterium]|nr:hypothetical protein [Opitutaceae bacterium]
MKTENDECEEAVKFRAKHAVNIKPTQERAGAGTPMRMLRSVPVFDVGSALRAGFMRV